MKEILLHNEFTNACLAAMKGFVVGLINIYRDNYFKIKCILLFKCRIPFEVI
jgi:hypothetical protein